MANMNYTTQARTASGINLVLGAWLVISAWIFGYGLTTAGVLNSVVIGALMFFIGLARVISIVGPGLARVNVLLGLWTIASPWVFGYAIGEPVMWNSIVVGILVALLGLWSASATVRRNRQNSGLATGH